MCNEKTINYPAGRAYKAPWPTDSLYNNDVHQANGPFKAPWPTDSLYNNDVHQANGPFKEILEVSYNFVTWYIDMPGIEPQDISVYTYRDMIFVSVAGEEKTYLKLEEVVTLQYAEYDLGVLEISLNRPYNVEMLHVDIV